MYELLKKILFKIEPENAHWLALQSLKLSDQLGLTRYLTDPASQPVTLMGLTFPNRIGLAAGLDKNADYLDALGALGFGFIEIGTVTVKPQTGNPKPRLFRLINESAIINRMGFNSKGMDYVTKRLETTNYRGILGINIGKNRETDIVNAIDDYLTLFKRLWSFASYITINISSPNTPGLRALQHESYLNELLQTLKQEQQHIHKKYQKYVPLVVKISPDLTDAELKMLANVLLAQQIDGVIATNTTVSRRGVEHSPYAKEAGGLSGKPLTDMATHIIKKLRDFLPNEFPIIASGGVMDEASAREKLNVGATLLQIYTGFIYSGRGLLVQLASL